MKFLLASLLILLNACSGNEEITTLTVSGSSTVAPLVNEIARSYENLHADIHINVQTGGSSRGIADAQKGLADIGMASRELKSGEQNLTSHTIAWDGISLIVHRDNPVKSLTDEQVRQLFSGQINSWSALGGPNARPVIVNKAQGRSTLELFLEHFDLSSAQIRADVVIGDNQQGIKTVAGNPAAVGYVSIGAATVEATLGTAIKLLPLDGIEPTLRNVALGRFPIARPLNLLTKGQPGAVVGDFIQYAQSPALAPVIEALYFIPAHAP